MATYIVVLTETISRSMLIEADNASDALKAGVKLYNDGCFAPDDEGSGHKEMWVDAPAEGMPDTAL